MDLSKFMCEYIYCLGEFTIVIRISNLGYARPVHASYPLPRWFFFFSFFPIYIISLGRSGFN